MTTPDHWQKLLSLARDLTAKFEDAVFIGGVAVAAYTKDASLEEASHDADMFLSLKDKVELRDVYEVRRNERLEKDSLTIDGEDVDLYVEHQNSLAVPFEIIKSNAEMQRGIRVASLEHLLILKVDAAIDRKGSSKGEKDVSDIIKLLYLLEAPRQELLRHYLTPDRLGFLDAALKSGANVQRITANAHVAAALQKMARSNLAKVKAVELNGL